MKTTTDCANVNLETHVPRILALGFLVLLLLLLLTGCQHEPGRAAIINPAGVYTLVSVDGQAVPCDLTHEGVAMTVKAGTFTINRDGTCRSLSTFAVPPHPDVHRDVQATYTQQGAELTMRWPGAGVTKGRINGDQFNLNNEGMSFCYRK